MFCHGINISIAIENKIKVILQLSFFIFNAVEQREHDRRIDSHKK